MTFLFQKHTIALSCIILFIGSSLFAQQNFQGKAYYFSNTSMDMSRFDNPDFSEEQKKRIMDRMKSMFQKKFILSFNQTESLYKKEEKLEAPTQGGGGGNRFGAMMSGATDGDRYKNIQTQKMLKDAELLGKAFLISDPLEKLEWKMTGETKNIGQYTCFKATAKRVVTNTGTPGPPPRGNKKEEESQIKEKEIIVTAWYTMQIPVSHGPDVYWGLPGLILEISADNTTILCSKIVLNPVESIKIKKPTKGKKVSEKEYAKISLEKFTEMRENFRRGRGQNSDRRR
ncbi:GLPGLI family protein [Wenyingzhuangia heitensis]|uniref:GLPGLI family protein n=1 Tax=Wenyingzhuangia heitensis TaxID=1487859 RepID=A0ABX0U9J2_9FLAO|nr:GLPGLI family protein [Wenyingzhuangia heitensis]NIJ43742.1 GLPGLI family protein [Wenyingzhuangia heitensis]